MICEARTCVGCQYLENEQDEQAYFTEFLTNCQHAKCKVVHLVRQQISKLQNTQYKDLLDINNMQDEVHEETQSETSNKIHEASHSEAYEAHDGVHEWYKEMCEVEDKAQQIYETQETQRSIIVASQVAKIEDTTENSVTPWYRSVFSTRVMHGKWMLQILNRIGYRAHLIIAAAVLGIIVWITLIYGVFLGATACGNGRIYFASSLKYTHAKRSLF